MGVGYVAWSSYFPYLNGPVFIRVVMFLLFCYYFVDIWVVMEIFLGDGC